MLAFCESTLFSENHGVFITPQRQFQLNPPATLMGCPESHYWAIPLDKYINYKSARGLFQGWDDSNTGTFKVCSVFTDSWVQLENLRYEETLKVFLCDLGTHALPLWRGSCGIKLWPLPIASEALGLPASSLCSEWAFQWPYPWTVFLTEISWEALSKTNKLSHSLLLTPGNWGNMCSLFETTTFCGNLCTNG